MMRGSIARFSQVYLERPTNLDDSQRMRKRISSYYKDNIHNKKYTPNHRSPSKDYDALISKLIEQEVGISVPVTYDMGVYYHTQKLLEECEIRDFIDAISIINSALVKNNDAQESVQWIQFVERVFREEGAAYSIDDNGLVHLYVDEEFTKNHQTTLTLLDDARYDHVRAIYENAYSCLRSDKQDTRTAIKDMFESIETLSKLLDNKIKVLAANEVNNNLKAICERIVEDKDEKNFIKLMISSLANWVSAHHIYRHGQEKQKHTPPSPDAAVLSLSTGSAYLRYLVQIDQKNLTK